MWGSEQERGPLGYDQDNETRPDYHGRSNDTERRRVRMGVRLHGWHVGFATRVILFNHLKANVYMEGYLRHVRVSLNRSGCRV